MDEGCGSLESGPLLDPQLLPFGGFDMTLGLERIDVPSERNSKLDGNAGDWDGFSSMAHPVSEHQSCGRTMSVNFHSDDYRGDVAVGFCSWERRRKQSATPNFTFGSQSTVRPTREEESPDVADGLSLKLCPTSFFQRDNVVNNTRCTKRFCSASHALQSPMCQVDDCNMDLKHAKDYHRRHKICEHHAKASRALVQKVMQRFCQQCSRFHPLQEFDEDKRSCRRRLAGHNKRRRKTNLDTGTNNVPLSQRTDLLAILALLLHMQAAKIKEMHDVLDIIEEPSLQGLKQADLNSVFSTLLARAASQNLQTLCGQQVPDQGSLGVLGPLSGLSQATRILLLHDVLTAQIGATKEKSQQKEVSQQIACQDQNNYSWIPDTRHEASNGNVGTLPPGLSRTSFFSELQCAEFSNRESGPKHYSGNVESCTQESDLESPPDSNGTRSPTEWNFFPMESGIGITRHGASDAVRAVYDAGTCPLMDATNPASEQQCVQRLAMDDSCQQPSDSSETRSDESPATSNSGSEELSGRIIFKLCDPSRMVNISHEHQSQLQEWLSIKPGWIEWYLRPGCILLTLFLSMPARSWEELVIDLPGSLKRLVKLSDSDIWMKGRILVQVRQQRALIINGKVKKLRWPQWSKGPVLLSVRPLAVLAGEEATLAVHGYNLLPRTKILCVYHGRYVLHEVATSTCENTLDDRLPKSSDFGEQVHKFRFPGGPPNVIGRCFIEVENDLHGNILPVIVADKAICRELSSLEDELDFEFPWHLGDKNNSFPGRNKQAEIRGFLEDLGWLFQRTGSGIISSDSYMASALDRQFAGLLMFAISRDWCAVVYKLLDLLFLIGNRRMDEVMLILSEVSLVHQAVKRKCKSMVELLLDYVSESGSGSGGHRVFTPVMRGPAGLTPLHVAASIHDAEDIIDALTNDRNEAGLWGWCTILDDAGCTPEWHARNSGNYAYLHLVERKQMMKRPPSVCIDVTSQTKIGEDGLSRPLTGALAHQQPLSILLPAFSNSAPSMAPVCRECRRASNSHPYGSLRANSRLHWHLMTMMVAVAALCAVVTVFSKTLPHLDYISYSLKWESIMFGPL